MSISAQHAWIRGGKNKNGTATLRVNRYQIANNPPLKPKFARLSVVVQRDCVANGQHERQMGKKHKVRYDTTFFQIARSASTTSLRYAHLGGFARHSFLPPHRWARTRRPIPTSAAGLGNPPTPSQKFAEKRFITREATTRMCEHLRRTARRAEDRWMGREA